MTRMPVLLHVCKRVEAVSKEADPFARREMGIYSYEFQIKFQILNTGKKNPRLIFNLQLNANATTKLMDMDI